MPIKYSDGIKKPNQSVKLTRIQKEEIVKCDDDDVWDKSNAIHKQLFKWTRHPNYNSDWKAAMVNDIGIDTFNKEYNCEFSD